MLGYGVDQVLGSGVDTNFLYDFISLMVDSEEWNSTYSTIDQLRWMMAVVRLNSLCHEPLLGVARRRGRLRHGR